MELKKALAIGAVAACSALFNGCAIVPANGYVTGYSAPTYYAPAYPAYGPSFYVAPRIVPNWGYNHNWNNNRGWAPRHYAPPQRYNYGGGHYRR